MSGVIGLYVVGTQYVWQILLVWGGYAIFVHWSCTVSRPGCTIFFYGYGTFGIIVHPFAGALGPAFMLMVDNNQLRRARGV